MTGSRPLNTALSLRAIEALLSRMPVGSLEVIRPDGTGAHFSGTAPGPAACVRIKSSRASRRIITGGAIGLAEGYMEGEWDSPDLTALLDLGVANLARVDLGRLPTLRGPLVKAWHRLRDNTRAGSKRNIAYHYDLGNDFYELWLDETMAYSCALYCDPESETCEDLRTAQHAKWNRLLEMLQPSRKDHLLEIGCGWGGFAIHAAKEAGCRITGVTISEEQHEWAVRRVSEAGLEGQVDIRLQDYRDISETFSRIASIEMFEAVGERYWPLYFGRVRDLLARGGSAAIQTITIRDESFEHYRDNPDFIQRYIFPGGMLPSPERFAQTAAAAGLKVGDPHFFGSSYATTLENWLERFDSVKDDVLAMGFDERFVRMWRYYLAYCRAGFRSGNINVMQVGLSR